MSAVQTDIFSFRGEVDHDPLPPGAAANQKFFATALRAVHWLSLLSSPVGTEFSRLSIGSCRIDLLQCSLRGECRLEQIACTAQLSRRAIPRCVD